VVRAFRFARRRSSNGASPEDSSAPSPDRASAPFGISYEPLGGDAWLFTLEGELDLASAGRLRDALEGPMDDGASGIVFDMARCSFVDSSGLKVLLEARQTLDGSSPDTRVVLVAPAPQPERLLRMTSVDTVLPVFDSREEAEAALTGSGRTPSSPSP
jgi:anti-anti-sigma factor